MTPLIKTETLSNDLILVSFNEELRALSSTIYGGGFRRLKYVLFKKVKSNFRETHPEKYASKLVNEAGLPLDLTAVFLTSTNLFKNHILLKSEGPPEEEIFLTLGLSPPACIDALNPIEPAGTINIILTINDCLSTEAVIDLVMLLGGVKSAVFSDLGIACEGFKRAFSTVTDAVIVAYRSRGCTHRIRYGGPSTNVGKEAAKLVYNAIMYLAQKNVGPDNMLKYITSFSSDELVNLGMKIYEKAPVPGIKERAVKDLIRRILGKVLKDPNTWMILRSAQSMSFYGNAGTIPGLSNQEYFRDSKKVLSDELLGIALSIYINGWKGMFNYYWIDRLKENFEEFKNLPMFIDDVVAALVGGILSKVYDELITEREERDD